jgi:3-phenylpropionate/trans-cinnamate dioxygenase ferredoxin subunit
LIEATPFRRVAAAADIPEGKMLAIELDTRSVLVCHTREGWYTVDNICTHADARLNEGRLRGIRLVCPLHGAVFDCRNGQVLGPPAVAPLNSYPTRIRGEDVEVAIDD